MAETWQRLENTSFHALRPYHSEHLAQRTYGEDRLSIGQKLEYLEGGSDNLALDLQPYELGGALNGEVEGLIEWTKSACHQPGCDCHGLTHRQGTPSRLEVELAAKWGCVWQKPKSRLDGTPAGRISKTVVQLCTLPLCQDRCET